MANRTFLNPVYKLTRAGFCFRMFLATTLDLAHRGWVRWACPTQRPSRPPMLRRRHGGAMRAVPIATVEPTRPFPPQLTINGCLAPRGLPAACGCISLHPYQCNGFINKYCNKGPSRGNWVSLSGNAANNTEERSAADAGLRGGLNEHGFHDQLDSLQSGDKRRWLRSQQVTRTRSQSLPQKRTRSSFYVLSLFAKVRRLEASRLGISTILHPLRNPAFANPCRGCERTRAVGISAEI